MIRVRIARDSNDCVRRVEIRGHAGVGVRGSDPACAAVSVLAKAYALTLTEESRHEVYGELDRPGEFVLGIKRTGFSAHAQAAGRVLLNGLESVQAGFADSIEIEYAAC